MFESSGDSLHYNNDINPLRHTKPRPNLREGYDRYRCYMRQKRVSNPRKEDTELRLVNKYSSYPNSKRVECVANEIRS